jgi:hypothetical protein
MNAFFIVYITVWSTACALAVVAYLRNRGAYALSHSAYWRFLLAPWKVATFAIATTGMTVVAPYSGDPTWDYTDSLFMSALTYASAPWAVGAVWLVGRRRLPRIQAFVAMCALMFAASWSYDLYLLLRDGRYPLTWLPNIVLSSILYISAGLLWNLEWKDGRGVTFAFMEEGWPDPARRFGFGRIAAFALPFMGIAVLLLGLVLLALRP